MHIWLVDFETVFSCDCSLKQVTTENRTDSILTQTPDVFLSQTFMSERTVCRKETFLSYESDTKITSEYEFHLPDRHYQLLFK